jgi:hypothetical protein
MNAPPDAIIITISAAMLKEKGLRNWLRNFLDAMARENHTYWFRLGSVPRFDELLYVYLCIGGYVKYRCFFAGTHPAGWMTFQDGKQLYGKAWVYACGPVRKAPERIPMKGFRGFRYTHKLF